MNKKIFSTVLIFIVLTVGAIGIYLWSQSRMDSSSNTNTNSTNTNSAAQPDLMAGWKTFTDSASGASFKYPEQIDTQYITIQDWPPVVTVTNADFSCTASLQKINTHDYCILTQSEGAAGSVYTTYTYTTLKDAKVVSAHFVLRYSQCDNYSESEKTACEQERQTFDLNTLIDTLVQTVK